MLVQIAPLNLVPLSNSELSYTVLQSNLAKKAKRDIYDEVNAERPISETSFDKAYMAVKEEAPSLSDEQVTERILDIVMDNPLY